MPDIKYFEYAWAALAARMASSEKFTPRIHQKMLHYLQKKAYIGAGTQILFSLY